MVFIEGMLRFPEVQEKAQAEIQRVVGSRRLPGFEDRGDLPYVEGVVQETLRSHSLSLFMTSVLSEMQVLSDPSSW